MTKAEYNKREETVKNYLVKELTAHKEDIEDISYIEHHVLNALHRVGFYITNSFTELESLNNPSLIALYSFGYKVSYETLLSLGVFFGKNEDYMITELEYSEEFYKIALDRLFTSGE